MIRLLAAKILKMPLAFDFYQWLVGIPRVHRYFFDKYVGIQRGDRVLDLGCGVGAGPRHLPKDIDYIGVDLSEPYIAMARRSHPDRTFMVADITKINPEKLGTFDKAYAFGVLHHLSDEQIQSIAPHIGKFLKEGASFYTIDPCFRSNQGKIDYFFVSHDRGEYVRDLEGYRRLFAPYGSVDIDYIDNKLNIPFTQSVIKFTPHKKIV